MLSMLLLIAAAPQSVIPTFPPLPVAPRGSAEMPVIGMPLPGCRPPVLQASDPTTPGSGLTWREGGEAVGFYRLLDRYVDGCPAPIIVNYRVPGSNALGREMGRDPAPLPGLPPRR
jgi:hypothetical protein